LGDATRAALLLWRLPWRAFVRRLDEVVPRSLPLVVVTVAAVGVALADQAARQALRLLGDQSFIGPEFLVLGVEEFGPLVVALTLSQRVGAGFAAEVATLQSEDTLDAMALFGERPSERVLAPMAAALVVGAVALGLLGLVAWELAGMATLLLRSGISPFTFFHPEAIRGDGVALLVLKCAAAGAIVFATATRARLAARGGALAVGGAAARAVVGGVLGCLLCSAALDMIWFVARAP
jgi:phospholipid/cholesterol/gamma-HCH transport system permease protein